MVKQKKLLRRRLAGISGIAFGIYILIKYSSLWGLLPLSAGFLMLLWYYKNGS